MHLERSPDQISIDTLLFSSGVESKFINHSNSLPHVPVASCPCAWQGNGRSMTKFALLRTLENRSPRVPRIMIIFDGHIYLFLETNLNVVSEFFTDVIRICLLLSDSRKSAFSIPNKKPTSIICD